MFRRVILEPFCSLVICSSADWYGNINMLTVPIELRREEDDFGLVGAEPVWQWTCWHEPTTKETLARVEWPPFIDQTIVAGTVGARVAGIHLDAVDIDL